MHKPDSGNHAGIQASGARVLVLGRSPDVVGAVAQELTELGVTVRGSTEVERAADHFDAREFDLITFGRGLVGPVSARLRQDFARQNPQVRFLETYAPLAAHQIATALAGEQEEPGVDLDAYFARIGYSGPRTPTLETLRALQELHPASIPFENIDVLLGRGVDITPTAVDAKLVQRRRGGYCFEHNSLFKRVLTALGFQVEGLLGRVIWMAPPGARPSQRTHMALRVTLEGKPWLVDVGFGSCVPTSPLRMDTAEPQPTRHETFRVFPIGTELRLQARLGDVWKSVYDFSPEPQLDMDYEVPNWFVSTHPTSHFRRDLIAARTTKQGRYTLLNGKLTLRTPDGRVERQNLRANQLEQALAETFDLAVEPTWRPVIESAAAATAAKA